MSVQFELTRNFLASLKIMVQKLYPGLGAHAATKRTRNDCFLSNNTQRSILNPGELNPCCETKACGCASLYRRQLRTSPAFGDTFMISENERLSG